MFKDICGGFLQNYGIFIHKDVIDGAYWIPLADGSFEPVNSLVYNAYIITKNFHKRYIIRAFKL